MDSKEKWVPVTFMLNKHEFIAHTTKFQGESGRAQDNLEQVSKQTPKRKIEELDSITEKLPFLYCKL